SHSMRTRAGIGSADGGLEILRETGAIRQSSERILVGKRQDFTFALRDAVPHMIEAGGQYADLVSTLDFDRSGIVTLLDARGGARDLTQRPGDIESDGDAAEDGERQAGERED